MLSALLICLLILLVAILIIALYIWSSRLLVSDRSKKCVFITGTDSGFGKKLALTLDKMGVQVYAGCFTDNGMSSLLQESCGNIRVLKIDVRDAESLLAARNFIESDLEDSQYLWGLVNNAGIAAGLLFHLADLEDYKTVMDVNFYGVVRATEIFLPLIKKSRGRIVNVISIVRRSPSVIEPYTASKVAMAVYNDGLRRCMKEYGVHVAGIEPGFFQTNITAREFVCGDLNRSWKKLPKTLKEEYGEDFIEAAKSYAELVLTPPLASFNRLSLVSNAMTHALFAKFPKYSYICGYDASMIYRFGIYLPSTIMDHIIRFLQRKCIRVLRSNLKNNSHQCC